MQLSYKYLGTKERKWEKLQYENLAGKLHLYINIYIYIYIYIMHSYILKLSTDITEQESMDITCSEYQQNYVNTIYLEI